MRPTHLLATAVVALAAVATPTSAMAATEPPPVEFLTEGEVQLHTATEKDEEFEPGTVYWEAQFKWRDSAHPYVASWERTEGLWESADQARAHFDESGITAAVTESRQCQIARVRDIAVGTASYDEFRALSGVQQEGWTLTPETWDEINLACAYEPQEQWEWAWERTASTTDAGTTTVRIPIDVIGPGEHELFVAPYGYGYVGSSQDDPLCRVHTWPDGGWASRPCRFEWQATATTTVTVPEPPSPSPTDTPAEAANPTDGPNALPIFIAAGVGLAVAAGVVVFIVVARRRRSQP